MIEPLFPPSDSLVSEGRAPKTRLPFFPKQSLYDELGLLSSTPMMFACFVSFLSLSSLTISCLIFLMLSSSGLFKFTTSYRSLKTKNYHSSHISQRCSTSRKSPLSLTPQTLFSFVVNCLQSSLHVRNVLLHKCTS